MLYINCYSWKTVLLSFVGSRTHVFILQNDVHLDALCKCSDVLPTKKLAGCSQTQSRSVVGAFRINGNDKCIKMRYKQFISG